MVTFFCWINYYSFITITWSQKRFLYANAEIIWKTKQCIQPYFFRGFKSSKVSLFLMSIGGLLYILFTIKMLLQITIHTHNFLFLVFQSNHILLCFITIAKSKKQFWYAKAEITRKKRFVNAHWFVCAVIKHLRSRCFVCLLVGYFTS